MIDKQREGERWKERERKRERDREAERKRERETERKRERQRGRKREFPSVYFEKSLEYFLTFRSAKDIGFALN